jgi:hypothetical protein
MDICVSTGLALGAVFASLVLHQAFDILAQRFCTATLGVPTREGGDAMILLGLGRQPNGAFVLRKRNKHIARRGKGDGTPQGWGEAGNHIHDPLAGSLRLRHTHCVTGAQLEKLRGGLGECTDRTQAQQNDQHQTSTYTLSPLMAMRGLYSISPR